MGGLCAERKQEEEEAEGRKIQKDQGVQVLEATAASQLPCFWLHEFPIEKEITKKKGNPGV